VNAQEQAGQAISAVIGALVGWMGKPGELFGVLGMVVLGLLFIDYGTAHRAARLAGELIESRKMHQMMAAKLLSYGTAFGMMFLAGFAFRSWLPITAILGWITYCELTSNLENLRKMSVAIGPEGNAFYGGVKKIADSWLGRLPGAKEALGADVTISQTTTTDRATTTTTQTDTQVHVSPSSETPQ
jgi:hypothetical protein